MNAASEWMRFVGEDLRAAEWALTAQICNQACFGNKLNFWAKKYNSGRENCTWLYFQSAAHGTFLAHRLRHGNRVPDAREGEVGTAGHGPPLVGS